MTCIDPPRRDGSRDQRPDLTTWRWQYTFFMVATGFSLPHVLEWIRTGRLSFVPDAGLFVLLGFFASPYLALAGLSWLIRSRSVLVGGLVALVAIEIHFWFEVMKSTNSTAALGLVFIPFWQFPVVALIGFTGWWVDRRHAS